MAFFISRMLGFGERSGILMVWGSLGRRSQGYCV